MNASNNPYTTAIPTGKLNQVTFTQPQHVAIQWPSISGNTQPSKPAGGFFSRIFG